MFEEFDDVVTIEELCEMIKIGKNNAYKLLKSGKIKSFKNGTTWRIPKQAVIEFIIDVYKESITF